MKPLEAMARALYELDVLCWEEHDAEVGRQPMAREPWDTLHFMMREEYTREARAAWSAAQPKVEEMVRRAVYQGWCNSDQAFGHGEWVDAIVSRVMEGGK